MGKEALLKFFAWGPQSTMSAEDGNNLKGKAIGENIFLIKKNLKKKNHLGNFGMSSILILGLCPGGLEI